MRGKDENGDLKVPDARITPAYAGKSPKTAGQCSEW